MKSDLFFIFAHANERNIHHLAQITVQRDC